MDAENQTEDQQTQQEDPKGLRKQIADQAAVIRQYRQKEMADAIASLGLEADAGLGKAIAKEYDGEVSTEAIAAYAKEEYQYDGPVSSDNPVAPAIQAGNERLEQIDATSGSVPVPSQQDELAQAEAEGDWQKAMALKGERVAEAMRPRI